MGDYEYRGVVITYINHDCFRIRGSDAVVYIDPFKLEESPGDGDVVVCTHDHYDHCSPVDVEKVAKPDATIVAAKNCRDKVRGLGREVILLSPGESAEVKGIKIWAFPAYNIGKPYHPKNYGGIGVVVEVDGVRIYHAGDTDYIPEMLKLENIDIALLPVSGKYVMDVEQAVKAAKAIKPKVAIPMHYGAIVGSRSDANRFKELLGEECEVVILK